MLSVSAAACALALLATPADAAPPSTGEGFDCSGLADGNYPDPNANTHYVACVAQTYAYSMVCASNHDGNPLYYIANSGPDPATSRCDYPEVAAIQTPSLTAGTAKIGGDPRVVQGLTATVLNDGQRLRGAWVEFTDAEGAVLCGAFTRADGVARCDSAPLPTDAAVLAKGYTATYAGGGDPEVGWQPASGTGSITV
ncbi:carbohydrate-binding module family 14 protein [Nocardia sp. NPDC050712]|uniref:carbohydrate-binding module family 14 protein n=1 Tax=Nocardia sp. NPDC050712 TaxID=3155518 RepID=UPI0033C112F4